MAIEEVKLEIIRTRPRPPDHMREPFDCGRFIPALELRAWANTNLIGEGPIFNPDHNHLLMASIGYLWTNRPLVKGQRSVVGMCQLATIQGDAWKRGKFEQQLNEWFDGEELDFLITIYAPYAAECGDVEFCGLVDHELYHAGQAVDRYGCPKFNRETGEPEFQVVGHDVEEHIGIMRRYGVDGCAGRSREFVALAAKTPEIAPARIAAACGTCLRV